MPPRASNFTCSTLIKEVVFSSTRVMEPAAAAADGGGDDAVLASTKKIPLLTVKAGPRDGEEWSKRLKEEYKSLIEYVKMNKEAGTDWFKVRCLTNHFSASHGHRCPRAARSQQDGYALDRQVLGHAQLQALRVRPRGASRAARLSLSLLTRAVA